MCNEAVVLFAVEFEHENGAADDIRSLLRRGLAENRIRADEGATWYEITLLIEI